MPDPVAPKRAERLLSNRGGRQVVLVTGLSGERFVLRRIPDDRDGAPDPVARAGALGLIRGRSLPHLVPIDRTAIVGQTLEVTEPYIEGFSMGEAVELVRQHVTVNVALAIVHELATGLAALHAVTERDGRAAHLIHGRIDPDRVFIALDGSAWLSGLEGLRGDPRQDADGLMTLTRTLLESRGINPQGRALLERLSELEFATCDALARAIHVYLTRQDADELSARRRRFEETILDALGRFGELEQTHDGEDELDQLYDDDDYPEDDDGLLPMLGADDVEALIDDDDEGATIYDPVPAHLREGDTTETRPSEVDLARSRPTGPHRMASITSPEHAELERSEDTSREVIATGVASEPALRSPPREASAEATVDPSLRRGVLGTVAAPRNASRGQSMHVGDYRVVASIGRGGMGEIYLARALKGVRAGERVALKVLPAMPGTDHEDALGMLMDEAAIMARIEHPNVLKVIDFGRALGRHYLATEYLEGRPLVRVMIEAYSRENGMDYGVIAAIGADSAHGLYAAHTATTPAGVALKVVHRDVSPQNIFVTYSGVSRVIDFGVARAVERVSRTQVGMVKGKAAYMSPEQVEGREVDARSDVFSLGICLWEMTAGRRLFKRDQEYDTLLAVQTAPIDPPTVVRGMPNPVLDHIILSALARETHRRTQSAKELAAQLSDFAAGTGVRDRHGEVAALLERLFGEVAKQEKLLIATLEERAATPEEAEALRALSGVSSRGAIRDITLVGEPESLAQLDDFGLERSQGSGPVPEVVEDDEPSTGAQVIQAVRRLHEERSRSEIARAEEGDFDGLPTGPIPDDLLADARDARFGTAEDAIEMDDSGFEALPQREVALDEGPPTLAAQPAQRRTDRPLVLGLVAASLLLLGGVAGWGYWAKMGPFSGNGTKTELVVGEPSPADGPDDLDSLADEAPEPGAEPPANGVAPTSGAEPPANGVAPPGPSPFESPPIAGSGEVPSGGAPSGGAPSGGAPSGGALAGVPPPVAPSDVPPRGAQPPTEPAAVTPPVTPKPVRPPPPAIELAPIPVKDPTPPPKRPPPPGPPPPEDGIRRGRLDDVLAALKRGGLGVTVSEGTYLIDGNGTFTFDEEAKVTRVKAPGAEGYIVETKSPSLTSVGWVGSIRGGRWVARGLSVNDCRARATVDSSGVSIRYGAQDIRLPHGGGPLTDVSVAPPELATRVVVEPLGLSFGEKEKGASTTHCKSGWWGKKLVLRRLPLGRYTLRYSGGGVTQTATLEVAQGEVRGGDLIRTSAGP